MISHQDSLLTLLLGDCRAEMATLPDASVDCSVTSPPYWGLRDYGVEGQMGQEKTPEAFIEGMVAVFREVRRLLKPEGTCWINIGDSYAGGGGHCPTAPSSKTSKSGKYGTALVSGGIKPKGDVKAKDLVGIPWMLAFALRADGWYLRQEIIWAKPNPMPESVTDRCTKAHESIFLLTKSPVYYFDHEAIKEAAVCGHPPGNHSHRGQEAYESGDEHHRTKTGLAAYAERKRASWNGSEFQTGKTAEHQLGRAQKVRESVKRGGFAGKTEEMADTGQNAFRAVTDTRNKRSVWTVPSAPCKDAHFATYPPDLIKPCILAGCPVGGVVLDPFGGSGTTGEVALDLGRRAILIELNPAYMELIQRRTTITPGFALSA